MLAFLKLDANSVWLGHRWMWKRERLIIANSDHQCAAMLRHGEQGHASRIARLPLHGLQPGIHVQFIARTLHQSSAHCTLRFAVILQFTVLYWLNCGDIRSNYFFKFINFMFIYCMLSVRRSWSPVEWRPTMMMIMTMIAIVQPSHRLAAVTDTTLLNLFMRAHFLSFAVA